MKKVIVVLLFLCLISSAVFAGGSTETENTSGTQTSVSTEAAREAAERPKSLLAGIIFNIGRTFSKLTTTIALGLHPFPSTIARFYDLTQYNTATTSGMNSYDNTFESKDLLLDPAYYSDPKGFFGSNSDEKGSTTLGANGIAYLNGEPTAEKSRWSVTAYLFIILFAAEVTFTAVFGYVMPEQEGVSVLKLVATKAAKTLVLFFLAAALPFLIEATRFGLFEIAKTYSYNPKVEIHTMFEMPAVFVERMANLVDTLSWKGDASPIFNDEKGSFTGSLFGKLIGGLIFIVFEFYICMEILKSGMHILMNVIEVYLLLAAVMLLLPFTSFTPTRGMVQGCVKSLFMNLIECFIIMLILLTAIPACERACKSLYLLLSGVDGAVATVQLDASQTSTFNIGQNSQTTGTSASEKKDIDIDWQFNFTTTDDALVIFLACRYADENNIINKKGYYTYVYNSYDLNAYKDQRTEQENNAKYLTSLYMENIPSDKVTYFNWDNLKTFSQQVKFNGLGGGQYVDSFTKAWDGTIEEYCDFIGERILYNFKNELSFNVAYSSCRKDYQGYESSFDGEDYLGGAHFVESTNEEVVCVFGGQRLVWLPYNSGRTTRPDYNQAETIFDQQLVDNIPQDWIAGLIQNNSKGEWRRAFVEYIRTYGSQIMMNKDSTENASTSNTNDSVVGQMLITWILIFLPCYFIKQSSQITTGLQTGHVGMESFANAISGFTGAIKTSAQILANTGKTAVKGANYVVDHGRARRDSANTSNMVSMMEQSNKNQAEIANLLRGNNNNNPTNEKK